MISSFWEEIIRLFFEKFTPSEIIAVMGLLVALAAIAAISKR